MHTNLKSYSVTVWIVCRRCCIDIFSNSDRWHSVLLHHATTAAATVAACTRRLQDDSLLRGRADNSVRWYFVATSLR